MKNLLAFHDAGFDSGDRLDFAIGLAKALDAHLTTLALAEEPVFVGGAGTMAAAEIWTHALAEARREAAALAAQAAERIADAGVVGDARTASLTLGSVARIAALHARYADLSIVAPQSDAPPVGLREEAFDGALFDSGRPVLATPATADPRDLAKRPMIAWDGGPLAARAIGAAMPLLQRAETISVAVVDPKPGRDAHGEEPGGDIALSLARHGLPVEVHQLPGARATVAETLTAHARDWNASMLVMGGFGRSRLRESIFGGVSREMLREPPVPLFMAH